MLTALLIFAAVFVVFALATEAKDTGTHSTTPYADSHAHEYHHRAARYSPTPNYSPDGRYIWDGEKWVEYGSNGGAWLILGLAAGIFLAYLLLT